MESYEKLNLVLESLSSGFEFDSTRLSHYVNTKYPEIDFAELWLILDKLEEDKNIKRHTRQEPIPYWERNLQPLVNAQGITTNPTREVISYSITFQGKELLRNGGYSKKEDKPERITHIHNIDNSTKQVFNAPVTGSNVNQVSESSLKNLTTTVTTEPSQKKNKQSAISKIIAFILKHYWYLILPLLAAIFVAVCVKNHWFGL
jgi:hypothetical protein